MALDLPLQLLSAGAIESCPATSEARAAIAEKLSVPGEIGFVVLSVSGFEVTSTQVFAPYRLAIFAKQTLPIAIYSCLLGHLAKRIYVCSPDQRRNLRICERAFFLWENRTGRHWWDPASNWLEAEREDTIEPSDLVEVSSNEFIRP